MQVKLSCFDYARKANIRILAAQPAWLMLHLLMNSHEWLSVFIRLTCIRWTDDNMLNSKISLCLFVIWYINIKGCAERHFFCQIFYDITHTRKKLIFLAFCNSYAMTVYSASNFKIYTITTVSRWAQKLNVTDSVSDHMVIMSQSPLLFLSYGVE